LGLSRRELEELVFGSESSTLAQLGRISSEKHWLRVGRALGLSSRAEVEVVRRRFYTGDVVDTKLVQHIRQLRGHYKTALLSNASASLAEALDTRFGLRGCFDVTVVSGLLGVMKPDPVIYRLTLNRLGVAPHEAIFVDDMRENVEGAAAIGMHAIQFTTRDALFAELRTRLGMEPKTTGESQRPH